MTLTPDALIAYLRQDLNIDQDIAPETELFSSGMLDSVAMTNIIIFLEEQAGIVVRPADVTLENFDSVGAIVSYAHAGA
jgi:acyl carrier protein